MAQQLLTVAAVAQQLNIPATTVYELIRQNLIPAVYVGRSVRISDVALNDWIANGGARWEGGWRKNNAN